MAAEPNCTAVTEDNPPWKLPNAVLAAPTITGRACISVPVQFMGK